MNYVRAFIAGFIATLVFHQGVIWVFHYLGAIPMGPFNMAPTPPFGVPAVISLAFWGGVWGVVLWPTLRIAQGASYWLRAIVLGAIGPTAVALLVVVPIKTGVFPPAFNPKLIVGGLIVNGAWGFGLALLMKQLRKVGT
jgi:hypothetical protein